MDTFHFNPPPSPPNVSSVSLNKSNITCSVACATMLRQFAGMLTWMLGSKVDTNAPPLSVMVKVSGWLYSTPRDPVVTVLSGLRRQTPPTVFLIVRVLNLRRCTTMNGNVLFNNALDTFYLRLYGIGHMVKDHSARKETWCCHLGYSFQIAANKPNNNKKTHYLLLRHYKD